MSQQSVVVMGLPGSGKTTFLAALWHVLTANEVACKLKLLELLQTRELPHLNEIAKRWRKARTQERTRHSGDRTVTMKLQPVDGTGFDLTFPDMAGESFQRMWEARDCTPAVADSLLSDRVMLFVHADGIRAPGWIVDDLAIGLEDGAGEENQDEPPSSAKVWEPRHAPTQVQLVDLLQLLQRPPLATTARRLVIVLSAWDKVAAEGLSPADYLARQMPLLQQYLSHGLDKNWTVDVMGISAQGGEYDEEGREPKPQAQTLRELDDPSLRIQVVSKMGVSHDLTTPLHWLLE